ncbi:MULTISPECIES: hypothetical protein [Flavobacterium]|jgi:hypothetical protein|uniref:Uncharacterized protein n=1 Tax=Flavobacterium lindanitolerans TaxID=428988 RepID=A0A497UYH5_9FLAO|nr:MULTISPECIES: hypothetical protein [Flavobacterium]PZO25532.1 MAG: hypothetical protein DCE86_15480 [Flavobacteriaceae bacterium]PZQ83749.1 MAG: hypothetical protein DI548_10515 [Flavobacterium johnsoniae]KQS46659.1 hypothetical protein ASG38_12810 [Flavobacterium sp. Leaf359]OJX50861.1 MAG: hypothetical protein BGO88_06575 [Flavobacterium sp. 38-13]PKW28415.1 hypothetical protein B0G92_0034 [Flavobacterium lindanitolerans]
MDGSKYRTNKDQKSLLGRFLLILGMLFFLMYFVMGMAIIFWKDIPIEMPKPYRIAFGLLLIVYSFFRFIRFIKKDQQ